MLDTPLNPIQPPVDAYPPADLNTSSIQDSESTLPVLEPATSATSAPQSSAPSVLIAEDEEALRTILIKSFQDAGFTTLEATDGVQALNLALQHKPTVTILDIMMPNMDGLEALKKMRLDPWGKNAMVIMLTNLTADNKILQDLSESAPSYYFVKSDMEPDQLITKVKEILA